MYQNNRNLEICAQRLFHTRHFWPQTRDHLTPGKRSMCACSEITRVEPSSQMFHFFLLLSEEIKQIP